jgi:Ca-activated chloride channel family protein
MFRFGSPLFLYVYFIVPLLVLFLWWSVRARRKAVARFGDPTLVEKLSRSVSRHRRLAKSALVLLAVALLVSAMARPQFGTRVETVRREGKDVIIALDVSASMLAQDVIPSRLDKAKLEIGKLIDRLEGDRIGLVAFAGEAFVQSPLTTDHGAASMFLRAMEPNLIPVPGTNLGEALIKSVEAFEAGEPQYRLLVLMTDGEDHEGDIESGLERAAEAGVTIHTVGLGSPDGVPIPNIDENGIQRGFVRDSAGGIVLSRLDEGTLRDIARETGGRYFRASTGQSALDALADEVAVGERRELEAQQFTRFEEQYQIFLGLALLVLTVEILVTDRRRVIGEWKGRFQ